MSYEMVMQYVDMFEKNKRMVIGTVIGIGLLLGSIVYYRADVLKKEEAAYEVLENLIQDVESAYQNADLWQETEKAVDIALNQFGSTRVSPYLFALKAQVFIEKKEMVQAIAFLEKSIASMARVSSIDKLFLTKIAALRLATDDEVQREKGIQELVALSHDGKNIHAPYAQYMLAQYYDRANMTDKSKPLYEVLVQSIKDDTSFFVSPYALIARNRLKQIGV